MISSFKGIRVGIGLNFLIATVLLSGAVRAASPIRSEQKLARPEYENWQKLCVIWRPKGPPIDLVELSHWFGRSEDILRPGDGGLGYDTVLGNKRSLQKARHIISRIARKHHLKLEWLTREKLKKRLGNGG